MTTTAQDPELFLTLSQVVVPDRKLTKLSEYAKISRNDNFDSSGRSTS